MGLDGQIVKIVNYANCFNVESVSDKPPHGSLFL